MNTRPAYLPDRNIELRRPLTLAEEAAYARVASERTTITHLPAYSPCVGKFDGLAGIRYRDAQDRYPGV